MVHAGDECGECQPGAGLDGMRVLFSGVDLAAASNLPERRSWHIQDADIVDNVLTVEAPQCDRFDVYRCGCLICERDRCVRSTGKTVQSTACSAIPRLLQQLWLLLLASPNKPFPTLLEDRGVGR